MKKVMTGWLDVRWDDTQLYPTKEKMDWGAPYTTFFEDLEPFHGKNVRMTIEEITDEPDSHICPRCGKDDHTYTFDEYNPRTRYALMHCEDTNGGEGCGAFYEVYYKITETVTAVKVRE